MRLKWTTCTFAVLPGNHLCSFHALGLPDDANSFLRIVQVLQQHTDGVVPVSGASIGLESFGVPGGHRMAADQRGHEQDTRLHANQDLLAIRLHGFGILEVHLWRGDIWEQFSYLQPVKTGVKCVCIKERNFQSIDRSLSFSHQFLERM